MLEYMWSIGLMAICVVFALIAERETKGEGFDGQWQIAAHGAALLAIVISWDRTGAVLLKWLLGHLPQTGSQISEFTAYAIVGASGLVVVAGIPIVVMTIKFFGIRIWSSRQKAT